MPSEDKIQEHIYEMYYSLLNKLIAQGLRYKGPETIILRIDKIKQRVYELRRKDLKRLADKLLSPQVTV